MVSIHGFEKPCQTEPMKRYYRPQNFQHLPAFHKASKEMEVWTNAFLSFGLKDREMLVTLSWLGMDER